MSRIEELERNFFYGLINPTRCPHPSRMEEDPVKYECFECRADFAREVLSDYLGECVKHMTWQGENRGVKYSTLRKIYQDFTATEQKPTRKGGDA